MTIPEKILDFFSMICLYMLVIMMIAMYSAHFHYRGVP